MYNLEDARHHLDDLVAKMSANGTIADEEFAIFLGHVYCHLNRGWNSRNMKRGAPLSDLPQLSAFPCDLVPS